MNDPWEHNANPEDPWSDYAAWDAWMDKIMSAKCAEPLDCPQSIETDRLNCEQCNAVYWWESLGTIARTHIYAGMCEAHRIEHPKREEA